MLSNRTRRASRKVVVVAIGLSGLLVSGAVAYHLSPRVAQAIDAVRLQMKVVQGSSGIDVADPSRIQHITLPNSNGVRHSVWIYRPFKKDSKKLPVLYFLHGVPGEAIDGFSAGLAARMDSWIAAGGKPFVLVLPDGNGENHGDTEWADAADGSDKVESFVLNDVIPAVESGHRRDRSHRAIGGFSMGGYGAANIALRHPDLFGQMVSVSGYFHVDDPDSMFGNRADLIKANSPDQHANSALNIKSLLIDSPDDPEPVVAGEASRFAGILQKAGAPVKFIQAPGTHSWVFVDSVFPQIQQFLSDGWPTSTKDKK